MSQTIPESAYRTQVAYRSAGPGGVSACGFVLREKDDPRRNLNRASSEFMAIYLLRGSGKLTDWRGRGHRLQPGCVIQAPAGRPCAIVRDDEEHWCEAFIRLDGEFFENLCRLGCAETESPVLRPGLDLNLVHGFERVVESLQSSPQKAQPWTLLQAHQLLLDIYALDRRNQPHREPVEQACRTLSDDLSRDLNVDRLAGQFNMSYERFRKVFRDRMGVAPHDYRIHRRIDLARRMILEQRLSNREVASRLGYTDASAFHHQFKRVTGQTPEAFRVSG